MDSSSWARLRALFDDALDRPSAERRQFVLEATRDEPTLASELLRLLAEEERADGAFAREALHHLAPFDPDELVGRELSGYVLEEVIGRGGMGVVYRARQRAPRRTVALKTLSNPIRSAKDLSRFRLEVEVLGALQHRAIAQVYDAGTLNVDGQETPYVAMELVEGSRDIVRHAAQAALDVRGRVALAREACEGVHHAHRRGIVHRDLKPGNLLVDPSGQVKVIDFGLARVTDSRALSVSTVETLAGSVLGTLDYMSPEHVGGVPQDVDVRSDVFSLGCVLFELAVGRPPRDLAGLSLSQAIRRVDGGEIRVPREVPRPLRAVLARALARDPDQRYATAAELAADLGRFARGETVNALHGHAFAMLAGFSRRHRAVLLGLLAAIAALAFGLYHTDRARRDAVEAEVATRAEADTSLEIATSLGSVIASVQPFLNGREAKVIDVLRELEGALQFIQDRRARAAVGSVLGQGLMNLREFERAGPILEAATKDLAELEAEDSPRRLLAVAAHADFLEQTGEYERSLAMSAPAYPVARRRLGADSFTTRYLATNTGVCAVRLGRFAEARDLYRELVADALSAEVRNHQFEVATLERLAQVLMRLGEPEQALVELDRAQQILDTTGGSRSLFAVALKSTRAQIEAALGHDECALALELEALAAYEARTDTLSNALISALNASTHLLQLGRAEEAAALVAARAKKLVEAEAEPGRIHAHWWLLEAQLACRRGDFALTAERAREALELGSKLVPSGWPEDHAARRLLACAERARGEREAALCTVRAGLEIATRLYAADREELLGLAWREQLLLHELGRAEEAAQLAAQREAALRAGGADADAAARWAERVARAGAAFDDELTGASE